LGASGIRFYDSPLVNVAGRLRFRSELEPFKGIVFSGPSAQHCCVKWRSRTKSLCTKKNWRKMYCVGSGGQ